MKNWKHTPDHLRRHFRKYLHHQLTALLMHNEMAAADTKQFTTLLLLLLLLQAIGVFWLWAYHLYCVHIIKSTSCNNSHCPILQCRRLSSASVFIQRFKTSDIFNLRHFCHWINLMSPPSWNNLFPPFINFLLSTSLSKTYHIHHTTCKWTIHLDVRRRCTYLNVQEQTSAYLQFVTRSAALENFEATTLQHHGTTNLQENLNSWYLSTGHTVHTTHLLWIIQQTAKTTLIRFTITSTTLPAFPVYCLATSLPYWNNASTWPYSQVHYWQQIKPTASA